MKVFQIGFNRCGTLSICHFFNQNGHKAVHWDHKKWERHFIENHRLGKPLCEPYDDIVAWTDVGFIQRHFQLFAEQYPDAKFIYNIRPIKDWVISRLKLYSTIKYAYEAEFEHILNQDIDQVNYWKSEWLYHDRLVREYFVGDRAKRLLIFDIEKNTGEDIKNFLPELNFTNLSFPHTNKELGR